MKRNRSLKSYIRTFIIVLGVYSLYLAVLFIRANAVDYSLLATILYMPLIFISLLYVMDLIMDKLMHKRKPVKKEDRYKVFLESAAKRVNEIEGFSLEDFRRLRENERFQKTLHQCFTIYEDGEKDELNFKYISKKFKSNTNESKALELVIEDTKKMMGNQGKDYQK